MPPGYCPPPGPQTGSSGPHRLDTVRTQCVPRPQLTFGSGSANLSWRTFGRGNNFHRKHVGQNDFCTTVLLHLLFFPEYNLSFHTPLFSCEHILHLLLSTKAFVCFYHDRRLLLAFCISVYLVLLCCSLPKSSHICLVSMAKPGQP